MANFQTLIVASLLISSPVIAAPGSCSSLFAALSVRPYDSGLPLGLRSFRTSEVQNLTPSDVKKLNADAIKKVTDFTPPISLNRARSIEFSDAKKILSLLQTNEVVSYNARERYRRPDVEIGFCFGRATFTHLALLKMGLEKESILKAWVVGPMQTPGVTWDFHVATLAHVKDRGWMVIDSNYSEPLTLQAWFDKSNAQSTDNKLRIYITEPSKFGVDAGKYSRVQMGLDLSRETDWYQNYFGDMMRSIGPKTAEQLGLRRLPPESTSTSINPFNALRDFFSN